MAMVVTRAIHRDAYKPIQTNVRSVTAVNSAVGVRTSDRGGIMFVPCVQLVSWTVVRA
jgi:hypothetical protein